MMYVPSSNHTAYEWAEFEASRKARAYLQGSWKSKRIHVEIETSTKQTNNDFTHFLTWSNMQILKFQGKFEECLLDIHNFGVVFQFMQYPYESHVHNTSWTQE